MKTFSIPTDALYYMGCAPDMAKDITDGNMYTEFLTFPFLLIKRHNNGVSVFMEFTPRKSELSVRFWQESMLDGKTEVSQFKIVRHGNSFRPVYRDENAYGWFASHSEDGTPRWLKLLVTYFAFIRIYNTFGDGVFDLKGNCYVLKTDWRQVAKKLSKDVFRLPDWDYVDLNAAQFKDIGLFVHDYVKSCEENGTSFASAVALPRFCFRMDEQNAHGNCTYTFFDWNGRELYVECADESLDAEYNATDTVYFSIEPAISMEEFIREIAIRTSTGKIGNANFGFTHRLYMPTAKKETWLMRKNDAGVTTMHTLLIRFAFIQLFLFAYTPDTMVLEERECKPSTSHRDYSGRRDNKVRVFRQYTLKKTWRRIAAQKKKVFTCPAWGVKGHLRHYKNGKVIMIDPYVKGKDKAHYSGKEYVLMPKAKSGGV